jgi:sporulation protein YlmC with PRC-barrel domain
MREARMREGSYMEIEPGMRVIGPDGDAIGTVDQVVADAATGIFHGLVVRHSRFGDSRLVPGEEVEALHDGVVHVTGRWEELEPYTPVEERIAESKQGFV